MAPIVLAAGPTAAASAAAVPTALAVTAGEATIGALVAASLFFSFVAAVGFYRLPDVYARAHAASKSETLGALLALSAAAVAFGPGGESLKLAILALFVLVTGPTAAHAVVRAAADAGTEPWSRATPATDGGRLATDASSDAGSHGNGRDGGDATGGARP